MDTGKGSDTQMKTALTIAGADPSGWAGIQADLRAFEAFGVRGLSVITALTAQNLSTVRSVSPVPAGFVTSQVEALTEEFSIDAVKIGMLATAENADAVARLIRSYKFKNVVLDTVLRSTGGSALLEGGGLESLKKLIGLATVVTPNLDEASALAGIDAGNIEEMEETARRIHALGPAFVLVKGGHLKSSPVDVLYDGARFSHFKAGRLKGRPERFHGTGCMLSAAIAAALSLGLGVEESVAEARDYVRRTLAGRTLPRLR